MIQSFFLNSLIFCHFGKLADLFVFMKCNRNVSLSPLPNIKDSFPDLEIGKLNYFGKGDEFNIREDRSKSYSALSIEDNIKSTNRNEQTAYKNEFTPDNLKHSQTNISTLNLPYHQGNQLTLTNHQTNLSPPIVGDSQQNQITSSIHYQQAVEFFSFVNTISQLPISQTSTVNPPIIQNTTMIIQPRSQFLVCTNNFNHQGSFYQTISINGDANACKVCEVHPSQYVQQINLLPHIHPSTDFNQMQVQLKPSYGTSEATAYPNQLSETSSTLICTNSLEPSTHGITFRPSLAPQPPIIDDQRSSSSNFRKRNYADSNNLNSHLLSYQIDPISLGFLPDDFWASKGPMTIGNLKKHFFSAKPSKFSRFEFKLWNALAITKEYPSLFPEVGIKWVSTFLLMVHRDIFGKLLNHHRPSAHLFYSSGLFATHGFKEVTKNEAKQQLAMLKRRNQKGKHGNTKKAQSTSKKSGNADLEPNPDINPDEDIELPPEVDESVVRLFIHSTYEFNENSSPTEIAKLKWKNKPLTLLIKHYMQFNQNYC